MGKELRRELSIHIGLDDNTIIEELCMCLRLGNFDSLEEGFLIETKLIKSPISMGENGKNTENDEDQDFLHGIYQIFLSFRIENWY